MNWAKKLLTLRTLTLAVALGGLVACEPAHDHSHASDTDNHTQRVTDTRGEIAVPAQPQRVVVLDTASLDTLTLLDFPVAAVPQSGVTYPDFMARYTTQDYVSAGTLFEPDYEKLSQLDPDLIITGGRARDAYAELSKLAPTIDISLDTSDVLASLQRQTLLLGTLYGDTAAAEQVWQTFSERVDRVKAKTANAGTAMVVMIVGGRVSAYGAGSRFGFIYDALGFSPAVQLENRGNHGNPMSFELLLEANPDWLFVFSRDQAIGQNGGASAAQVLDNVLVKQTRASENNRIVYLDSGSVYVAGGLQTYHRMMDMLEQVLAQ